MDWTDCEPAKSCTTLQACRRLPGLRWAALPTREQSQGARGTSVELMSKVPLGLARPAVAITGLLTVLRREAGAQLVSELLWLPWASVFPKCLCPGSVMTAGPKWERRRRLARGGPPVGRETVEFGFWQELPRA